MGCCFSTTPNSEDGSLDENTPLLRTLDTTNSSLVQETAEQMMDINSLYDKLSSSQVLVKEDEYKRLLSLESFDFVFLEIDLLEFREEDEIHDSREFESFTVDFE